MITTQVLQIVLIITLLVMLYFLVKLFRKVLHLIDKHSKE
jgi:hypothetical protein